MPATVTIKFLGDASQEEALKRLLEQRFEHRPGQWRVTIIGDQRNTIWELKIKDPEGREIGKKHLYGEDGGHRFERILEDTDHIMREPQAAV